MRCLPCSHFRGRGSSAILAQGVVLKAAAHPHHITGLPWESRLGLHDGLYTYIECVSVTAYTRQLLIGPIAIRAVQQAASVATLLG